MRLVDARVPSPLPASTKPLGKCWCLQCRCCNSGSRMSVRNKMIFLKAKLSLEGIFKLSGDGLQILANICLWQLGFLCLPMTKCLLDKRSVCKSTFVSFFVSVIEYVYVHMSVCVCVQCAHVPLCVCVRVYNVWYFVHVIQPVEILTFPAEYNADQWYSITWSIHGIQCLHHDLHSKIHVIRYQWTVRYM